MKVPILRKKTPENWKVTKAEIRRYCQLAESLNEKLPLKGFSTNLMVPIRVEEIYVPLRAMINLGATRKSFFGDAEEADQCLRNSGAGCEISVPDAFVEAGKRNRRGIVILGDPGSGKTTHLRRLMLWCLRGGLKGLGLPKDYDPGLSAATGLRNLNRSWMPLFRISSTSVYRYARAMALKGN